MDSKKVFNFSCVIFRLIAFSFLLESASYASVLKLRIYHGASYFQYSEVEMDDSKRVHELLSALRALDRDHLFFLGGHPRIQGLHSSSIIGAPINATLNLQSTLKESSIKDGDKLFLFPDGTSKIKVKELFDKKRATIRYRLKFENGDSYPIVLEDNFKKGLTVDSYHRKYDIYESILGFREPIDYTADVPAEQKAEIAAHAEHYRLKAKHDQKGSELDEFLQAFYKRASIFRPQHFRTITIGGQEVDTRTFDEAYVKYYQIKSEALSKTIGVPIDTKFTQEKIDALLETQKDIFTDSENYESGAIVIVENELSEKFTRRPVDQEDETRIKLIEDSVFAHFKELDEKSANHWYSTGQPDDHGKVYLYQHEEIKETFEALMGAIRDVSDTERFKKSLFEFSALFGKKFSHQRTAAIETFTYLYVTKRFPSEGIRNRYLHFILRCGGFY